jgi:hypothetical protein
MGCVFFGSVEKTRVEEKVVFHARLAPVSRGVPQGTETDPLSLRISRDHP